MATIRLKLSLPLSGESRLGGEGGDHDLSILITWWVLLSLEKCRSRLNLTTLTKNSPLCGELNFFRRRVSIKLYRYTYHGSKVWQRLVTGMNRGEFQNCLALIKTDHDHPSRDWAVVNLILFGGEQTEHITKPQRLDLTMTTPAAARKNSESELNEP